ncbi:MAG TPA: glycine cleavage system aminomethyltransferase GcvT [Candidatus Omnitrophota bacterium]|mgnify:FL=1|jgi:aminomethyltransferase|nr:MAG: Aminomethyltransferase [Candidatus Omnitrophica bacterium ADurb.Bin314]HOE68117.1 glycine cleavage system aminomethyltransferase GcvT [Candidatus Omnitrophota bacterium]HQB93997.1 glycine cleavage system aminomethyltransferase GcvT [Candidatus Omnitrophota bacterium]
MTLETVSKKLPLYAEHVALGARMGEFGGWEVPLYYSSVIEEHKAVRAAAGIFDISHMGEILVEGPRALEFLERNLPRRIAPVKLQQAIYTPLLNDRGGMVDDIIVYRVREDRFLIIVNAGNIAKDFEWFCARAPKGAVVTDLSPQYGLFAVQGPEAAAIVSAAFGVFFTQLKRFQYRDFEGGIIARTGYTGEDGFEIMVPLERLKPVWDVLLEVGGRKGLKPVGFGARDTLRLEAAMPLYGHELSDEITPLEAGLEWAIDLTKDEFPGLEVLKAQKAAGIPKKRVGFEMTGRGIPRHECEVRQNGRKVGWVTSGSFIPAHGSFAGRNIGMAFVETAQAETGTEIDVMIRGAAAGARVVSLPFYKRK